VIPQGIEIQIPETPLLEVLRMCVAQELIQETALQEEPLELTKIGPIELVEALGQPLDTILLHVVQTTIVGTLQGIMPGAMQGPVAG
jgi:hypothetical protein